MMAEDLNAIVDRAMTALDAALRIAEDAPDEIEDAILSWQDRAVAEGHAAEVVEVLCDVVRDAIRQACEHWDGRCSVRIVPGAGQRITFAWLPDAGPHHGAFARSVTEAVQRALEGGSGEAT